MDNENPHIQKDEGGFYDPMEKNNFTRIVRSYTDALIRFIHTPSSQHEIESLYIWYELRLIW